MDADDGRPVTVASFRQSQYLFNETFDLSCNERSAFM